MGFIKEWQDKLGVKIVCSQVRGAHQTGQPTLFPLPPPTPTPVHAGPIVQRPFPCCCCGVHRKRSPWAQQDPWLLQGTSWMTAAASPSSC